MGIDKPNTATVQRTRLNQVPNFVDPCELEFRQMIEEGEHSFPVRQRAERQLCDYKGMHHDAPVEELLL